MSIRFTQGTSILLGKSSQFKSYIFINHIGIY